MDYLINSLVILAAIFFVAGLTIAIGFVVGSGGPHLLLRAATSCFVGIGIFGMSFVIAMFVD